MEAYDDHERDVGEQCYESKLSKVFHAFEL